MKYIALLPIAPTSIFFGLWQDSANAGGFVFSLMLFVCYVLEYIKGDD